MISMTISLEASRSLVSPHSSLSVQFVMALMSSSHQNSELRTQNKLFRSVRPGDSTLRLVRVAIMRVTLCIHIYSTNAVYLRNTCGGRHSSIHSNIHCLGSLRIIVIIVH